MNITNDFEQQHIDVQNRLEALIKENEEQSDTIKKLKKKLKTIRNTGADQKTELNQLQKSKDILQKNYDDLAADFAAYKEKAEFVLKQQSTDKQRVNENFEIEELQRQLKLKAEQINQLSERSVSYQQEINSAQERCRVLRSELEDARQSIQIAHKSASDERKRLALEYEQRIRQLTKELEDNKRDLIFVREHATNERQKMEEINARVVAELNNQIEDLQFKLTQLNADRNVNVTNETKQVEFFYIQI
jgi:chromosome segregation ATPase